MLFWHKHDLEKAVIDLANFTPFPDEWSKEDKVLFEQAFQFHGKCFHRIRQMVSLILRQMFLSSAPSLSFSAARQIYRKPRQILLFMEENTQPNERDGPTRKEKERRWI